MSVVDSGTVHGLKVAFEEDGIRYALRSEPARRRLLGRSAGMPEAPAACRYLEQLEDEGLAARDGEDWLLPWPSVYYLLDDEAHSSSLELLQLPAMGDWVPSLETRGSPSEPDFQIGIGAWLQGTRGAVSRANRRGAVIEHAGAAFLLSREVFELVQAIRTFMAASHVSVKSNERLRAFGKIRTLALDAGAKPDALLTGFVVIAPERVRIGVEPTEALGTPVIKLRPMPEGAPDSWIQTFDQFSSAQPSYDVIGDGGSLIRILPSPEVQSVLTGIKTLPGRLAASDEALAILRNPGSLIEGDSADVVDLEGFARERRARGLELRRAQVPEPAADADHVLVLLEDLEDAEGGSEPIEERIDAPGEARQLAARWQRAEDRSLLQFFWRGHVIETGPSAASRIATLHRWAARREFREATINYEEVFDLSLYSDRVIGFESGPKRTPFIGITKPDKPWLPSETEVGIVISDGEGGPPRVVKVTPGRHQEIKQIIQAAFDKGQSEIDIPEFDGPMPVDQAAQIVDQWDQAELALEEGRKPKPAPAVDPKPSRQRPSLSIFHNILELEYTAAPESPRLPALEGAPAQTPSALRPGIRLLPHQVLGFSWLRHRMAQGDLGVTGCLLADDMGLGKTLQALCLIADYRERSPDPRPCLVVAPVSLLDNWRAEVSKFFDESLGEVTLLYGDSLQQWRASVDDIDAELREVGLKKFLRAGFADDAAIVLTTYETLRDYDMSLARVHWGIVVCDEAQKIKNPAAQVTQSAKALLADFKIACTGTPVENSLGDLWCLFDFFQPGLLGAMNQFTRAFRRPIELREDGHEAVIESLRAAIDPWVIRRMKHDVASDLPPKIEGSQADVSSGALSMSTLQLALYQQVIRRLRKDAEDSEQSGEQRRSSILQALHTLRLVCANPIAASGRSTDATPLAEHLAASPKLVWTLAKLEQIRERGEKVIIFTEFRDIQRLLQSAIQARFDLRPRIVNGDTKTEAGHDESRQRLIDQFQDADGFNVIILSTTAVGFGVNIQRANHVIHFTRPWNPAKEDQATDRAYRIGQERTVYVYCPTVTGTGFASFEERLAELLESKRALSRDMLAPAEGVTAAEFEDIFEQ